MTAPTFPLEPLAAAAGVTLGRIGNPAAGGHQARPHDPRHGYAELGILLDVSRTTLVRWRTNGLTIDRADECALKLGLMPHEVWPRWYAVIAAQGAAAVNAGKLACPQGHPYSGLDNRGKRICTPCKVAKIYEIRRKPQVTGVATPDDGRLFAC